MLWPTFLAVAIAVKGNFLLLCVMQTAFTFRFGLFNNNNSNSKALIALIECVFCSIFVFSVKRQFRIYFSSFLLTCTSSLLSKSFVLPMFVVCKRFTHLHCAHFPAYSFPPCGQVLMLVLVMQQAQHGAENCLRMRNLEGKSTFWV